MRFYADDISLFQALAVFVPVRFLRHPVDDVRTKVAIVLWGIWRERNRRVSKSEACTARTATNLALDDVANWAATQY
ncbi:hypothetical protein LINPERHAP2_LOCUS19830 [Linum perenne]